MSSTVITVPGGDEITLKEKNNEKNLQKFLFSFLGSRENYDMRRFTHSIRVGIALVCVSLLYILDPLYEQVGDNAMWAIMTVIVIFEFYAGATLSKGLNRGLGTIIGGGSGYLAAVCGQEVGRIGNAIIVGCSVFAIGAGATYCRLLPSIKKSYDYGAMIFILTFNLVAVSGLRGERILEIARDRLATIGMGFAVCIFISFLVFPVWASDEIHYSIASKFEKLASCIEGCLEEHFEPYEKEKQHLTSFSCCKVVLYSKSQDESLAKFARWEPWNGKFGHFYPWEKYLQIGEALRELAATTFSLRSCLQSPRQPSQTLRQPIKEPCKIVASLLAWTLRELGESIMEMRRCHPEALIASKLQRVRLELSLAASPSAFGEVEDGVGLAVAHLVFLLGEMAEKVEELAKEVEDLGELAGFQTK